MINKVDTAPTEAVDQLRQHVAEINPGATILEAASPISVADPGAIEGNRVLVVEDGPTLTHGGMSYGAGVLAARRFGAKEIIDPRAYAVGSLQETFRQYPRTGNLLPAMGYGAAQIAELETTINQSTADLVVNRYANRSGAANSHSATFAARPLQSGTAGQTGPDRLAQGKTRTVIGQTGCGSCPRSV